METVTDHTLAIRNVTIDSLRHGKGGPNQRFALSWEQRDARYHIWFDKLDDLNPDARTAAGDGILYKNPLRSVERREDGFYWTRRLDPAAKANLAPVEAARRYAMADNLYQKALAAKEAEREAAARETEKALRVAIVRDAGPALLAALELAEKTIQGSLDARGYRHGEDVSQWEAAVQAELAALVPIRAAIAKARSNGGTTS